MKICGKECPKSYQRPDWLSSIGLRAFCAAAVRVANPLMARCPPNGIVALTGSVLQSSNIDANWMSYLQSVAASTKTVYWAKKNCYEFCWWRNPLLLGGKELVDRSNFRQPLPRKTSHSYSVPLFSVFVDVWRCHVN